MRKLFLVLLCLGLVAGCATVNVKPIEITPARMYAEAQTAYLNAWDVYHKTWMALPDTDSRKAEWVDKYHPIFVEAGELLLVWGKSLDDEQAHNAFDLLLERAENILIELAIKGGK